MFCNKCGSTCEKKSDEIEVRDHYVGSIKVKGLIYYKCSKCGEILYSLELAQALDNKRKYMINRLLAERPISDFINASEAAKLLNISRQALHKNRRIQHGFIFQTQLSGTNVFLKQSVLQYKKTGDGRFSLTWSGKESNLYIEDTIPLKIISYQHTKTISGFTHSNYRKSHITLEESTYAKN